VKIHAGARTCPHCRALIVNRVIEEGQTTTEVARQFRVSVPTVIKWVRRYRRDGADGLSDKSSRPHRIPRQLLKPGKELHDAVMSVLHTPPIDCGFNRTTWRLRDLRGALAAKGVVASQSNIRQAIRDAGYQWKKARVSLTSRDPEYRSKLDAIKAALAGLGPDEAFFSIDELGPVAVKMRGGLSLQGPNTVRTIPQWQKSRGAFILTAALELSKNQITYFFSDAKNTKETIHLIEVLRRAHRGDRNAYLSWDAAPWHSSKKLEDRIVFLNEWAAHDGAPVLKVLPLPSSAQFLNVIESVFSGLARAVLHNSDYASLAQAKEAVARYIDERNLAFQSEPRRAGRSIWRTERVPSVFGEANNCKDLRYT
jgi:transposase